MSDRIIGMVWIESDGLAAPKTYRIKYAMPFKPILDEVKFSKKISNTVYACGNSLSVGSRNLHCAPAGKRRYFTAEFVKGNHKKRDFAESN